ncbi:hypothetical protein C0989_005987 [Termitomyces sp. Mn162]|nr:hypothetical protein C0989_005987 [Termitomyces sp. Mn162]
MEAPVVHLRDIQTRSRIFTIWEKQRNKKEVHWFMEILGWRIPLASSLPSASVAPLLEGTSTHVLPYPLSSFEAFRHPKRPGKHFTSPLKCCKLMKSRYIFAQIVGAYLACLVIYTEWKVLLVDCEAILEQAGQLDALQFTPNGPAGIFGLYLLPGQTLPRVFLNEFVTDTLIGLVLFAAIDPTNALVPPVMASVLVALA